MTGMVFALGEGAYSLTFTNMLIFLLMSLLVSLTFFVFDIKKLPSGAKRVIHVILNYVISGLCLFVISSKTDVLNYKTYVVAIVAFTFAYAVIYLTGVGLSNLGRKFSSKKH